MVAYPGSVVYHAPSGLENREGGKLAGPRPLAWAVLGRPVGAECTRSRWLHRHDLRDALHDLLVLGRLLQVVLCLQVHPEFGSAA